MANVQPPCSGGGYNRMVASGPVNPPCIIEPAASFTSGIPELWVAVSGGANWGGCAVHAAFDGPSFTAYKEIGIITQGALQGVLTAGLPYQADPDTTNTLAIDLTQCVGIMPTTAIDADADALRTLVLINDAFTATVPSNGELMAYGNVSPTGTYTNDLTYLRRGKVGTQNRTHIIGSFFTRIDVSNSDAPLNSLLRWKLPAQYVGVPLSLKFQSVNIFDNNPEDYSGLTAYEYTPSGAGYGGGSGSVPSTPTGLAGVARGPSGSGWNQLSWNANPYPDIVQYYTILRKLHSGSSYSILDTAQDTVYQDNSAVTGITYDYELTAHNASGDSSPAGPVTLTTN